jgi:hypothetical protein
MLAPIEVMVSTFARALDVRQPTTRIPRFTVDGADVIHGFATLHVPAGIRGFHNVTDDRIDAPAALALSPFPDRAPMRAPGGDAPFKARARCPPVKPLAPVTLALA